MIPLTRGDVGGLSLNQRGSAEQGCGERCDGDEELATRAELHGRRIPASAVSQDAGILRTVETAVISLPDPADGSAHGAALRRLSAWLEIHPREVSARWVLSAGEVMVVAAPEALRKLDPSLPARRHPRTTRWAMLGNVRQMDNGQGGVHSSSSTFAAGTEVIVLWPVEAKSDRLRVLGEKPCRTQVTVVRMPRGKIENLRVGKLDHPALLYRLGLEDYWPANLEAHQKVTRLAHAMRTEFNDGRRD